MISIQLGNEAKEDIRDIRIYSKAQFGAVVARTYLNGLDAVFALLQKRPNVGALEEDLEPGVRGFAYRSHRIYYRLDGEILTVIRILHHARDVRRWLGDRP